MNRVRVRSSHLGAPRPMPAHRAVGGLVQLVVIADWRQQALMIIATAAGALAALAFGVGVAVIA